MHRAACVARSAREVGTSCLSHMTRSPACVLRYVTKSRVFLMLVRSAGCTMFFMMPFTRRALTCDAIGGESRGPIIPSMLR